MNPLERFILWAVFIAVAAAGLAGYVAYKDHVNPILEMKQRIENIESIINRLPIKPFREEGDDATGSLDGLPTDTLRNIRDEAQGIIERRNADIGPNGRFQEKLNEFLNPGHVKRAV